MRNAPGDILAAVEFYATDAGGRSSPTPPDKLSCIMLIDGNAFDVRLHLNCRVAPGQTITVPISFLSAAGRSHTSIGKKFLLRELRTIAEGRILEVYSVD